MVSHHSLKEIHSCWHQASHLWWKSLVFTVILEDWYLTMYSIRVMTRWLPNTKLIELTLRENYSPKTICIGIRCHYSRFMLQELFIYIFLPSWIVIVNFYQSPIFIYAASENIFLSIWSDIKCLGVDSFKIIFYCSFNFHSTRDSWRYTTTRVDWHRSRHFLVCYKSNWVPQCFWIIEHFFSKASSK